MIHIGNRQTLMTACGKSVKRRWWQEEEHVEYTAIGHKIIKPRDANCKDCIKNQQFLPI